MMERVMRPRGKVTVNRIALGDPLEEAKASLGPVKEASSRNSVLRPGEKRYVSLNKPEISFHCGLDGFVKAIIGDSFEDDSQIIFGTGKSWSKEVLKILGPQTKQSDGSRQVWSYFELGTNEMGVNFIFDDGLLTGISTIDKEDYKQWTAAMEKAKN